MRIDGVPMRDSYYGNFNIDEILPINQIERIEIINGPCSVLYGANAFASVINISTKTKGRSVHAGYAEYDSKTVGVKGDLADFYGYLDYFKTNGFAPELNSDGKSWDHPQEKERSYVLLKHTTDSFQTVASYTDYEYQERYKTTNKDYSIVRKPAYISTQYSKQFNDKNSINIQGYISHYTLGKERYKYKSVNLLKSYDEEYLDTFLYGIDFDYSLIQKNHSIIAGISYQQDKGDDIRQRDILPDIKAF